MLLVTLNQLEGLKKSSNNADEETARRTHHVLLIRHAEKIKSSCQVKREDIAGSTRKQLKSLTRSAYTVMA
jgi:hypothetical protein